ncbi:uncharacterized protein MEPE_03881 [Melanopsichium pennsylvanicum]|uniref:Uncharacterized protein n=1 Tax=Melanopsichium pennsylvanicum TaxID=63383 RepID=A0AAJ5C5W0_9BASI|nr:uncharacterized protein MEPE_03881 [Melanopsichium pennsylvanicum]
MAASTLDTSVIFPPLPPYTLTDASSNTPSSLPKDTLQGSSQRTTPLPSYSSSPVLEPILATAVATNLAVAKLFTLTSPDISSTTTATVAPSQLPLPTLIISIAKYIASFSIFIFGTTLTNFAWITLLNLIGFSFVLFQLPLSLWLAREFDSLPQSSPKQIQNYNNIIKKELETTGDPAWIRRFSQLMWDIHDELEMAELHPPSTWFGSLKIC